MGKTQDQSVQQTHLKRVRPLSEPEAVQRSKRQYIPGSPQTNKLDGSQSLNAYINHLADKWPGETTKWLTWDGGHSKSLSIDRLHSAMSKWAQRCNLCHFQRLSKTVQVRDHSIADCKDYGAAWIWQQEKKFASLLERHVDNSATRFWIDCCLPGEWHLASETREKVMRRGLFGPTLQIHWYNC
jgi:hypothetical protein